MLIDKEFKSKPNIFDFDLEALSMQEIECVVNSEDLFTQLVKGKSDFEQSERNFIALLKSTLMREFPGSNVYVKVGERNLIAVDGVMCSPIASYVSTIIEKVIRERKWASKKLQFTRPELLN